MTPTPRLTRHGAPRSSADVMTPRGAAEAGWMLTLRPRADATTLGYNEVERTEARVEV